MARSIVVLSFMSLLFTVSPRCTGDDPKRDDLSFANDIAPVLVSECLACHNAVTAKGRFSVETYQSLMKGGESGEVISDHEPDFSSLVLLLESGDMPKEADPLPEETISRFKRWIEQGSKLEDSVAANAKLTSIIPKPTHPESPKEYRASLPVTAIAFRPASSEVAVSGYHELLLFDSNDGRLLRRIGNIAERVQGLSFSPDGTLIGVASGSPGRFGEVKVFDASTGKVIADLTSAGDSFLDVAFSPDGSRLAAAGTDRSVRIWTIPEGNEVVRVEAHSDWVTAVEFSDDGNYLATASRDKTAKVFDVRTQEMIANFTGHDEPVSHVLFSPDSRQVVSCGLDKEVRWWTVSDSKQKKHRRLDGAALALSQADAESFICGTTTQTIRELKFEGDKTREFKLHRQWIAALATTSDGSRIAAGSLDGQILIIDRESGETLRTIEARPPVSPAN